MVAWAQIIYNEFFYFSKSAYPNNRFSTSRRIEWLVLARAMNFVDRTTFAQWYRGGKSTVFQYFLVLPSFFYRIVGTRFSNGTIYEKSRRKEASWRIRCGEAAATAIKPRRYIFFCQGDCSYSTASLFIDTKTYNADVIRVRSFDRSNSIIATALPFSSEFQKSQPTAKEDSMMARRDIGTCSSFDLVGEGIAGLGTRRGFIIAGD